MEAIALGVPVLAFPSFGDHLTNAKFLVDVFGVGIKMGSNGGGKNDELVTRDEVKKCLLEATIGEKAERLKQNANKWKKKAEEVWPLVDPLTDILMHLSKTLRNIALLTFRQCNIIHFIFLVARSKHLCSCICVLAVVLCFKNWNKLASYGNGVIRLFWIKDWKGEPKLSYFGREYLVTLLSVSL